MDAKADEKWRWSTLQETGHITDIVRSNKSGITAATPDYLNALQQQFADAEAKAARYEEFLRYVIDDTYYSKKHPYKARASALLNPPSPITPGEAQG